MQEKDLKLLKQRVKELEKWVEKLDFEEKEASKRLWTQNIKKEEFRKLDNERAFLSNVESSLWGLFSGLEDFFKEAVRVNETGRAEAKSRTNHALLSALYTTLNHLL